MPTVCRRTYIEGENIRKSFFVQQEMSELALRINKVQTEHRLLNMATFINRDNKLGQRNNKLKRLIQIRCTQLDLQHSRTATYNLTQIIIQKNIDVAFVQEPYGIRSSVAGFPKSFRIFTYGNGRKRSAVIVNNTNIDTDAIKQASNEDATLIEFRYKGLNFYGASLYFDIDRDIETDIGKVEEIKELT
jgi:hypothetical protein